MLLELKVEEGIEGSLPCFAPNDYESGALQRVTCMPQLAFFFLVSFLASSVLVQLSLNCLLVNSFGSVREPSSETEEGSRTEPKLLTRRQFSESWTKTEGRKETRKRYEEVCVGPNTTICTELAFSLLLSALHIPKGELQVIQLPRLQ